MRKAIAKADIIVLTIGHNDTPWISEQDLCDGAASSTSDARLIDWSRYTTACSRLLASALRYNIVDVLGQIKKLRAGKTTLIRVTNFHNDRIGNPNLPRSADAPSKLVGQRRGDADRQEKHQRHQQEGVCPQRPLLAQPERQRDGPGLRSLRLLQPELVEDLLLFGRGLVQRLFRRLVVDDDLVDRIEHDLALPGLIEEERRA